MNYLKKIATIKVIEAKKGVEGLKKKTMPAVRKCSLGQNFCRAGCRRKTMAQSCIPFEKMSWTLYERNIMIYDSKKHWVS